MRLAVDHLLDDSESYGSPCLEYLKWPAPVRAGDALTLTLSVLEARRSEKRPDFGLVRWQWRMTNQRGEAVLELVATNLFDLSAR
jgi:acyl dehydratase